MNQRAEIIGAATIFRALGNESRLELLRLIDEQPRSVGSLAASAQLSQPLVSQHLKSLRSAGLVRARRSGREVVYELADPQVTHVMAAGLSCAPRVVTDVTPHTSPSSERLLRSAR